MERQIEPGSYAGTAAGLSGRGDGAAAPQSFDIARLPLKAPLLGEWEDLAARTRAAPFLHPGWVDAWWDAFGTGELEVRCLRRGGKLAAVMCLARRPGQLESTANYHTPLFGVLAEREDAAATLAEEVYATAPAQVSLTTLDPGSYTLRACTRGAEAAGFRVVTRPHLGSPYAPLGGSWTDYQKELTRSVRHNLKRIRKQLAALGELKVDIVTGGDKLRRHLNEAYVVEMSGWKGHSGTAILSRPHTQRFYTRLAQWAASRGMLRLYLLRLQGQAIAMCFTLQHHGACYMLKGGYDPGLGRYSPGTLVIEALMRDCVERGLNRVEFNGEDEPYKHVWARESRGCVRMAAFAPTVAGQLAWAGFSYSRPIASRLRQAFGWPQPGHRQ